MSVSQKSLRLFCILPSEIASTQQNIIPSSCTNIIDITHSERIPIPPQSWVRTREFVEESLAKDPLFYRAEITKIRFEAERHGLKSQIHNEYPQSLQDWFFEEERVGGLVSTESIWNLLPKSGKTRVIVDANLLPHEIIQLKKGMENGEIKPK